MPTAFITGASSGIGRSTAHLFANEGWNVVATMRNPDDAAELADIERVLVTRLDLVDAVSITAAVNEAVDRFGSIDALVNNAGYGSYGPLEATPPEVTRRQFDVNVFGLVETIRAVLPTMRANRSGSIINVSSVGGRITYPLGSLYHGSKWAVEGLSEALHYELSTLGIRVRIVEPGGVRTDFSGRSFVFTNEGGIEDYQPLVNAYVEAAQSPSPTGQLEPEDVAAVIWEAANDDSARLRYVVGDGANQMLDRRFDQEQDEAFVAGLRASFGL